MKSITVEDLDIKKDKKVDDFLNSDSVFKTASRTYELDTDKGCDSLFCDLYEEWVPESFKGFREKVASIFENRLDKAFDR